MIRFVVWDKDMPKDSPFVQDDGDWGPLESAQLFTDMDEANNIALECGSQVMAVEVTVELLLPRGDRA